MIRRIAIRRFVLIEELMLELGRGFIAFTGETGAGKSILLDALGFAQGSRPQPHWVAQGAARAEVEVTYELNNTAGYDEVSKLLTGWGIEAKEGEIWVRRILDSSGRSRAWVNNLVVTQAQLRALSSLLCAVYGQHAHLELFRASTQRRMLDRYAQAEALAEALEKAWYAWQEAKERLARAEQQVAELTRRRDELSRALETWSHLAFEPGGWRELEEQHARLAYAQQLAQACAEALAVLDDEPYGALLALARARKVLESVGVFDKRLAAAAQLLEGAEEQARDVLGSLRRLLPTFEQDPAALVELEQRMRLLHDLARRNRCAPDELPLWATRAQEELQAIAAATDIEALQKACAEAETRYHELAAELGRRRREAAVCLGQAVQARLPEVAFSGARACIELLPIPPAPHGRESVRFLFSAHDARPLLPLTEVASGGELARLGLVLQLALADAQAVPTLIFDEVDVGIGGAAAMAVGQMLRALGSFCQVLVVTHQPQVAAAAHAQFRVTKELTPEGEPYTHVTPLDFEERVLELARMVSGTELSDAALAYAREALCAHASSALGKAHS